MSQKLITGILAHVDSGKTTLSESLLFTAGAIRKLGRVDTKDAFLDTHSIEKERGITIFSKQALLNDYITLVDTPGHVDFASEMERALSILDCAILMINGSDGIQSHTKTLWKMLKKQNIPVLIFVNKMDITSCNKDKLLQSLKNTFSDKIIDFSDNGKITDSMYEQIASSDEILIEKYFEKSCLDKSDIQMAVREGKVYPCIFGSALKLKNIDTLINVLQTYYTPKPVQKDFGCIVYKISSDKEGNRLTHLKITGGSLKVKECLEDEKINEIRIYSGDKYTSVKEAEAGTLCTITGPKNSQSGKVYGSCSIKMTTVLQGALIYSVIIKDNTDTPRMLKVFKELEQELCELKVSYNEATKQIEVVLMGEVQTEIIKELIKTRYNIIIDFGDGKIAYKETVKQSTEGVGHYEPLKHYAEVHVKINPLPRGSGIKYKCNLSVDELDTNWQRLILTHLNEKAHTGVLTNSPLTDIEYIITAGKAHLKHTEGGDFRQATYRAIRHALMKGESMLLEPVYDFEITVPQSSTGRVMSDIERMAGSCTIETNDNDMAVLRGKCPVSTMKNYISDIRAFTKGQGTITVQVSEYQECHNSKDVIAQINYNPDSDIQNPASSVFCSHGAGYTVKWQQVDAYKHIKE